jgi:hypothetical protein
VKAWRVDLSGATEKIEQSQPVGPFVAIRIVDRDGVRKNSISSAERVGNAAVAPGKPEYQVLTNVHAALEDEIEVPFRQLAP